MAQRTNGVSRRALLSGGAAGSLTAAAFPTPAISQNRLRWKMVTAWPKNFPGLGTGAQRICDAISSMTNNRLEVKLYAAGEIVPALEVFDTVREGTAEMGHAAAAYWINKNKSFAFFSVIPGGLIAQEHNAWIDYGGGQELWDEAYGEFGLKGFSGGNTGTQMGGWFANEIQSVDDFKGLKMRIPGLAGEIINRAGGISVTMPGGEIMSSLQSGVVDAVEFAGPWTDLAFGFHKVVQNYYGPGFHEPGAALECLINLKAWESLPGDLQGVVRHAVASENSRMLSEFTAANAQSLQSLINDYGIMPRHFPDDVVQTMLEIGHDVVAETALEGDLAKRIYENWSEFRTSVFALGPFVEQGALNQRKL